MIVQLYSMAVSGRFIMIKPKFSCSFGLNLLGAQCAHEHGSVAILIVFALVLFPLSNSTRILAHSEINNTCGKNSRKYSNQFMCSTTIKDMGVIYCDLVHWRYGYTIG